MIDLMNLEPQKISRNLRGKFLLLYGQPGVGKTSLAAQFDQVLIAAFECGTNALNNVYVQPVKTWQDWKTMVSQLCRNEKLKERYQSVAVDTTDEAWNLCVKWVCSQNGIERLGELPYGQGYDIAKKEFASTFRDLSYSGYGIIFISHSTEKTFKNERGEEYTQIVPALPNRPFDVINKMVDIIAYIREISIGEGENIQRKRFMFLRDEVGDRFLVKSRYRYIVPRIELDYDKLVEALYNAIDKEAQASGGGETSNAENPFTAKNFDELMEDAKLVWTKIVTENKVDKASAILEKEFGKPTKFSEITAEQIDQLSKVLLEIRDIL